MNRPKAAPTLPALWARATAYCARAEHCSSQVRRKLQDWGCPKTEVQGLLDRLMREGWLDDARFARLYVRSKLQSWGRIKLQYMLGQLGVDAETIALAMAQELDEQVYGAQLHKAVLAKKSELAGDAQWRDKLKRHLYSRGYTLDEIVAALRETDR